MANHDALAQLGMAELSTAGGLWFLVLVSTWLFKPKPHEIPEQYRLNVWGKLFISAISIPFCFVIAVPFAFFLISSSRVN